MSIDKEIKSRTSNIRLRTWSLTLVLILCLIFYYLVSIVTHDSINWIDFIFVATIQIITFSTYFPDGDLYGQKDKVFIGNKNAYNEKANNINIRHLFGKLREFCKYEFDNRTQRYIENQCSIIGITKDEFNQLSQMDSLKVKNIDKLEINGKLIYFNKKKRKMLYNLIFGVIPIRPNYPETIMSAIENDGSQSIRNGAIKYKRNSYTGMILKATLVGLVLAYIGYTLRDGISFAQIVSIVMCLSSLFSTAVISFSKGEKCSKVYQNIFYMELANFIDEFFEWANVNNAENNLTNEIKETIL